MRRIKRQKLEPWVFSELLQKQAQANTLCNSGTFNVAAEWERSRKNKSLKETLSTLKRMAGVPERCMYCGDSHGTDIEHFWPKSKYPHRMFRWTNLLLCCTECGRMKGNKFPLDSCFPLLIKPTIDDPWDYLDFDPETGNLSPRYCPESGMPLSKGEKTVEIFQLDRREAMANCYKRSFHRIQKCIEASVNRHPTDLDAFICELKEADEHGLLGWGIRGTGKNTQPFVLLREKLPLAWQK